MKKPTLKANLLFNKILEKITNKEPFNLGDLMMSSGYSKSSARNPHIVINGPVFQSLLAQINDAAILARIYQIVFGKNEKTSLEAAKELLKLKQRYPDPRVKVSLIDERDSIT